MLVVGTVHSVATINVNIDIRDGSQSIIVVEQVSSNPKLKFILKFLFFFCSFLMTSICFVLFVISFVQKPFNSRYENVLEVVSMALLVFLGFGVQVCFIIFILLLLLKHNSNRDIMLLLFSILHKHFWKH